jgi:hypothetical protein
LLKNDFAAKQNFPTHQNHFLGHPHGQLQGHHFSNEHQNSHHINFFSQAPHYDKAQYVTMNINMNMYPNVMNVNLNQPYIPSNQQTHNPQNYGLQQPFQQQFNLEAKPINSNNINMNTNLNF